MLLGYLELPKVLAAYPTSCFIYLPLMVSARTEIGMYTAVRNAIIIIYSIGFQHCSVECDPQDIDYCNLYASPPPAPVPKQFLDVVEIVMVENNWFMPGDCGEALVLYLNLVNTIH